jgi:hypothetical protein
MDCAMGIKCSPVWTGNDVNLPSTSSGTVTVPTVIHLIRSDSSRSVRGDNRNFHDRNQTVSYAAYAGEAMGLNENSFKRCITRMVNGVGHEKLGKTFLDAPL